MRFATSQRAAQVVPGLTHKDWVRACAVQRLMGRFGNVQVT